MKARSVFAALIGLLASGVCAHATNPAYGVAVRISARAYVWFEGENGVGSMEISGDFLPSSPGGSDGHVVGWTNTSSNNTELSVEMWTSFSTRYVRVEPDKGYTLTVTGANIYAGDVTISAPNGYSIVIDNQRRSQVTFDGGADITFQVQSDILKRPGLAGVLYSAEAGGISFRIPMGEGPHGQSMGELSLVNTGLGSDWNEFLHQDAVSYEPTLSDAFIHASVFLIDGQYRNAKRMGSLAVVAEAINPQSGLPFEIRLYNRSQLVGYSFTGSPFITYKFTTFDQDGEKVLLITKNIVISGSTEYLYLRRKGTWPNHTWTQTNWSTSSDWTTALSETVIASTLSGDQSTRTEVIAVRVPTANPTPNPAALNVARAYTYPSNGLIGEALQSETLGSSNGAAASFLYYTNSSNFGSLGCVSTANLPGGNWVSYVYYGEGPGTRGQVAYALRPFGPAITAPPTTESEMMAMINASGVETTTYQYAQDPFGSWTRPSLVQKKIDGIEVAKTTYQYNFGSRVTQTDYTAMSAGLATVTLKYAENEEALPDRRNLPQSITKPNGIRQGYAYRRGFWDGATFVDNLMNPTFSNVTLVTGSSNSTAGVPITGFGSDGLLEPIYMVDGQSAMETAIRDSCGNVVAQENWIWKSGAWRRTSLVTFSYDLANRLVSSAKNGVTVYEATYVGRFARNWDRDESGTETTYTYDAAGRLSSTVRAASTSTPELKTRYTYDAAGKVLTVKTGPDSGEQVETARTYDDAGRLVTETLPGQGATTHSYSYFTPSGSNSYTGHSHTIARAKPFTAFPDANGGTTIETYHFDGRLFSRTGTGVVPEYFTCGVESDGRTWEKILLAPTTLQPLAGSRWKTTWKNWRGQAIKTERPGFSGGANLVEETFYNATAGQYSTGHVYRTTKPGPASGTTLVTRFDYDALGRVIRSGLDVGDNGLVPQSADRMTDASETLEIESGTGHLWWRKETYAYPSETSAARVLTSTVRQRLTGFAAGQVAEEKTIDADGNVTTRSQTVNRSTKLTTVSTTRTGIANTQVEKSENGLNVETTGFDGLTVKAVYDALQRPWKSIGTRNNNTTETTYVAGTRLVSSVREKAQTASPITVAQYTYDLLGRRVSSTDADNKATYFAYNRRDQPTRQWGAATYPVAYAYNAFGEKIAMRTFRNPTQDFTTATWPLNDDGSAPFDAYNPDHSTWSVGDKIVWSYDPGTGLLTDKTSPPADPASSDWHLNQPKTVTYTYNPASQLATREWSRRLNPGDQTSPRVKTTYAYSATTGDQTGIAYNDGTPPLTYTYTRLGQLNTVQDATSTSAADLRDLDYDPSYPHRLVGETLNDFYGDRAISRLYETTGMPGRPRGFMLGSQVGSNSELEQTYGYSATSGRFETLTSQRAGGGGPRTFRYAYVANSGLLQSLAIDAGGGPGGHPFTISRSFEDNRDVLTRVETKWSAASRTDFKYVVNALGYRQSVEQAGDVYTGTYSNGPIHHTFAYNPRGELIGAPARLGTVAAPGATIGNRQHEFDYDAIGNRKWAGVTGSAGDRKNYTANPLNQYSARDNVTAPFTGSQAFAYDDDGNLTNDGLWHYTWDAENRLVRLSSALPAGQGYSRLELDFKYDYLGRRVEKKVRNLDGPSPDTTTRFLYDGWSLVAEYNVQFVPTITLTLIRSYTWGLDIARSLADAGGVGALLQITDHVPTTPKSYLASYDGNGNVAALFDADASSSATACVAAYEYSPYGEAVRSDGTYATQNPFRFSTKFTDDDTGLVYYGRRYYSPSQGRFLGRDTIEERGGRNLYAFCGNNGVNMWDVLGMLPRGQARIAESIDRTIAYYLLNAPIIAPGFQPYAVTTDGSIMMRNLVPRTSDVTGGMLLVAGLAFGYTGGWAGGLLAESIGASASATAVITGASAGFASSAGTTALAGGDLNDILRNGLRGAITGGATSYLGPLIASSGGSSDLIPEYVRLGLSKGLVRGTFDTVLTGGSFGERLLQSSSGELASSVGKAFINSTKIAAAATAVVTDDVKWKAFYQQIGGPGNGPAWLEQFNEFATRAVIGLNTFMVANQASEAGGILLGGALGAGLSLAISDDDYNQLLAGFLTGAAFASITGSVRFQMTVQVTRPQAGGPINVAVGFAPQVAGISGPTIHIGDSNAPGP